MPEPLPVRTKPVLQKPPGYRDTSVRPQPPSRMPQPPRAIRPPVKPAIRRRNNRRCCRRICCWIFFILITLLFLLAIAGALAYLWFQPRLPIFHLASLQASHLGVAISLDGSGALFNVSVAVRIQAVNPNGKIGLSYGDSEARVFVADDDGDIDLGTGTAAGFVQPQQNATAVRFVVSASGVAVDDAVGTRLKGKIKRREIRVSVETRTSVGVTVGGKSTRRLPIRVACGEQISVAIGEGNHFKQHAKFLSHWQWIKWTSCRGPSIEGFPLWRQRPDWPELLSPSHTLACTMEQKYYSQLKLCTKLVPVKVGQAFQLVLPSEEGICSSMGYSMRSVSLAPKMTLDTLSLPEKKMIGIH